MAGTEFHLTNTDHTDKCCAIKQGETFNYVTFFYPDDVSSYTPRGEIRDNYADSGGNLLATFTFDPLVYANVTLPGGGMDFRTIIIPSLSAATTETIPFTQNRKTVNDPVIVGRNVYVYDIELELAGTVIKLAYGWVEVLPEVTR